MMVERYYAGERVEELMADSGIPRSTLYGWIHAEEQRRVKDAAKRYALNYKTFKQLQEHSLLQNTGAERT